MKKILLFIFCVFVCCAVQAQYAPQAGLPGSTAISAASNQFIGWAVQCTVQRGFLDIANPSLGFASAGDSSLAVGPADESTVSLGDSGVAVLTFIHPIVDDAGPDFAVFENGFLNPANDSEGYMELAFIEVSSDGANYFRFPSASLTQTGVQTSNVDYMNASGVNNLAGKYVAGYGTPFDLSELAGTVGLDVNHVTHVRVVDVVGSIGAHAGRDNAGRAINDPYPTPFPSCGFDLDAVGVIHQSGTGVQQLKDGMAVNIYPNPAIDKITVSVKSNTPVEMTATLTDVTGKVLHHCVIAQPTSVVPVAQYSAGLYYLVLRDANGAKWVEKVIKH